MGVVDGGDPPPPELALAWEVERWGTLPEAGGLYDQDVALLNRMSVLSNIYKAVSRLRGMSGAEIHLLSHGERTIIGYLRKQGIL